MLRKNALKPFMKPFSKRAELNQSLDQINCCYQIEEKLIRQDTQVQLYNIERYEKRRISEKMTFSDKKIPQAL